MTDLDFGIDLSDLDKGFSALQSIQEDNAALSGVPIELPIDDIEEDPHQPRQEFDAFALQELAGSIAADKVRVPISVKPKSIAGKYLINHGARRYRASLLAGKKTIPGFIDDSHDDYAQVVENIQRDNLTPLEIARFIEKRRAAGDKDKTIGERLGKAKSYISQYASLLTWPPYIERLYEAGHCKDVSTLYNLIQLSKRAPAEVETLCQRDSVVTRRDVSALEQRIADTFGAQTLSTRQPANSEGGAGHETPEVVAPVATAFEMLATPAVKVSADDSMKKPVLLVAAYGDQASLQLSRRAKYGHGWIRFQASGEEREVPLSDLNIEAIVEGQ